MKFLATALALAYGLSLAAQTAQPPWHSGGLVSDGVSYTICDEFQVSNDTRLYGVTWWGQTNKVAGAPQFTIVILSEFLGMPGPAEFYLPTTPAVTATGADFSPGQPEIRYDVYFPTAFVARASVRYWIEILGGGS